MRRRAAAKKITVTIMLAVGIVRSSVICAGAWFSTVGVQKGTPWKKLRFAGSKTWPLQPGANPKGEEKHTTSDRGK
jgi:hypothetical protein